MSQTEGNVSWAAVINPEERGLLRGEEFVFVFESLFILLFHCSSAYILPSFIQMV